MSNGSTHQPPVRKTFHSQGLDLSYWDWGNARAPVLILVHGGFDHARSWDQVAVDLVRNYHVVALDMRGHGESEWSPDGAYGISYYTLDLFNFIEHLGCARPLIVAHSLGAAIALNAAGLFPEDFRAIAAIEGLGFAPPAGRDEPGVTTQSAVARARLWIGERRRLASKAAREFVDLAASANQIQQRHPSWPPELALHIARHGTRPNGNGALQWKFDPLIGTVLPGEFTREQIRSVWRKIECPVLLCCGAKSFASDPLQDGRVQHFRCASISHFAKSGHWPHHEEPELFLSELNQFIAKTSGSEADWTENAYGMS